VLISAWCGLRWGEVTELRRKDIGAGTETIQVVRGVVHRAGIGGDKGCRVDTPKSGRGRTVVVPDFIRADIKHHLDTYVGTGAEALVFAAEHSCHLSDKTFRRYFADALASIGRSGVRIHDLRHFAGTTTALAGATLAETMSFSHLGRVMFV
jgi:integrase